MNRLKWMLMNVSIPEHEHHGTYHITLQVKNVPLHDIQ